MTKIKQHQSCLSTTQNFSSSASAPGLKHAEESALKFRYKREGHLAQYSKTEQRQQLQGTPQKISEATTSASRLVSGTAIVAEIEPV